MSLRAGRAPAAVLVAALLAGLLASPAIAADLDRLAAPTAALAAPTAASATVQSAVQSVVPASVGPVVSGRSLDPFAARGRTARPPALAPVHLDRIAGRSLVARLAPGVSVADAASLFADAGLDVRASIDSLGAVVLDAVSPEARDAAARLLARDPRVARVEPSRLLHASAVPNDPMLPSEWWLPQIDIAPYWAWTGPTTPVTIGIVDTGVSLDHPDLAAAILPGHNFVTPGQSPSDDSESGHGTHVAGIAAAVTDNGIGMAGVAPGAKILPVKVLDATGFADDGTAAAGIVWAADNGAKVVNLSFEGQPGGSDCSSVLVDAVTYALKKGAIVVAASGNSNVSVGCPARIPGVLAVGAVDQGSTRWSGSNTGDALGLVAPGVAITSTWPGSRYGTMTGTSMATPMVSGAAADLASVAPSLSGTQIRDVLTATAKHIGNAGHDPAYGYGLVDIGAAIGAAAEIVRDVKTSPAIIAADGSGAADAATLSMNVVAPVTGTVTVERVDGTVVRTLASGSIPMGPGSWTWDGRDDAGTLLPDGAYRFAIRVTGPADRKVALLRPVGLSLALTASSVSPAAFSPNGDGRSDTTTVTYSLRAPATVTVRVYDASHRLVRTLMTGARPAGTASVVWNGRTGSSATSALARDGRYSLEVAATTARGTYAISTAITLSTLGVAATALATTPVYPVLDGYRDEALISFRLGGPATTTVYVYPPTSSKPVRVVPLGSRPAGATVARWDGRDARELMAPAGTYRVRVRTVDAAGVTRWSSYGTVGVSWKRLVERVNVTVLTGVSRDPRSYVTDPGAGAVEASPLLPQGVRLRADSLGVTAVAFWTVSLPSSVAIRSLTLTFDTRRAAVGDSAVGTPASGIGTVDGFGSILGAGGSVVVIVPRDRLPAGARSFTFAVSQGGTGTLDIGSIQVEYRYAVLQ